MTRRVKLITNFSEIRRLHSTDQRLRTHVRPLPTYPCPSPDVSPLLAEQREQSLGSLSQDGTSTWKTLPCVCPARELRHYLLYHFSYLPAHSKDVSSHLPLCMAPCLELFVSYQPCSPLDCVCLRDILFVTVLPASSTLHST